jgi:hypothetical protein
MLQVISSIEDTSQSTFALYTETNQRSFCLIPLYFTTIEQMLECSVIQNRPDMTYEYSQLEYRSYHRRDIIDVMSMSQTRSHSTADWY